METRVSSRALECEFVEIARSLGGDEQGRRTATEYLAGTHALLDGAPTPWALTPKIFDDATYELLRDAAETMGSIMDKVTVAFRGDESLRKRFGLDPELARLCCLDTGYERQIPLARVDVFLDEDNLDFTFCELNTDGSAGMVTTDEVTRAISLTPTFREFERRHPTVRAYDVCEAWVDALLECYASWRGPARTDPEPTSECTCGDEPMSLAIVDFEESLLSADDVEHFVQLFRERGVRARFADVRALRLVEVGPGRVRLADDDGPIDCVWRRAVTGELFDRPCPGADALRAAVERNAVCMIGGYRTWPMATKTAFAVLCSDAAEGILDERELEFVRAHVPYTEVLSRDSDLSRFVEKDDWIVKPADGYAGRGVTAGLDVDPGAWPKVLADAARDGFVIQRYATQYATPLIPGGPASPLPSDLDAEPAANMEGLYLFNGRFSGVFTRAGRANIIEYQTSRYNLGCFFVSE